MGEHLLRVLEPPTDFLEEVTRRESIRRLSWFAHQINGPIGRADAALQDVQECLEKKSTEWRPCWFPTGDSPSHGSYGSTAHRVIIRFRRALAGALHAIQELLRKVNLSDSAIAPGAGSFASGALHKLRSIVKKIVRRARQRLPNLQVQGDLQIDGEIVADPEFLSEAFQEIFNNAIRELKAQKIEGTNDRRDDFAGAQSRIQVSIRDNGLHSASKSH